MGRIPPNCPGSREPVGSVWDAIACIAFMVIVPPCITLLLWIVMFGNN